MARLVSAIIAGVLACGLAGTAALAKEEEKKEEEEDLQGLSALFGA